MVGCAIIKYPSVLVMSTVGNEVTAKLAPSLGVTPKQILLIVLFQRICCIKQDQTRHPVFVENYHPVSLTCFLKTREKILYPPAEYK